MKEKKPFKDFLETLLAEMTHRVHGEQDAAERQKNSISVSNIQLLTTNNSFAFLRGDTAGE